MSKTPKVLFTDEMQTGLMIDLEVDFGITDLDHCIQARINVKATGVPHDVAVAIVNAADSVYPYSKALLGNIECNTEQPHHLTPRATYSVRSNSAPNRFNNSIRRNFLRKNPNK
ncbi:hypothetical protein [Pseudomonas sp. RIT-PI-q]|uniref:hypothetical protein n=1 Tax=Pseudomonas sp. RIT-PI-q TaxID=1690247 RepID=UPI000AF47ED3|nr:hypothetical protein [Pseudomonas sp. RIT-PI-q]